MTMFLKAGASLRKALEALGVATGGTPTWVGFTPTLTQGAGITITVTRARYAIIGKTALVQIRLDCTSAGTAGNNIVLASIPTAIAPAFTSDSSGSPLGVGMFYDAGTWYVGAIEALSSSTAVMITNAATNVFGVNPAITIASGDVVSMNLSYEIA